LTRTPWLRFTVAQDSSLFFFQRTFSQDLGRWSRHLFLFFVGSLAFFFFRGPSVPFSCANSFARLSTREKTLKGGCFLLRVHPPQRCFRSDVHPFYPVELACIQAIRALSFDQPPPKFPKSVLDPVPCDISFFPLCPARVFFWLHISRGNVPFIFLNHPRCFGPPPPKKMNNPGRTGARGTFPSLVSPPDINPD